jgi:hypothetical protein
MPNMFGNVTNHVIHKSESHKLHQSFDVVHDTEAGDDVYIGMPVKLVDDFTVAPLVAGDNKILCVGVAIHDTDLAAFAAGQTPRNSLKDSYSLKKVTVSMRAYMIIEAVAGHGGVTVGPVKWSAYDLTVDHFPHPGANVFVDLAGGDEEQAIGWALNAGDAGDIVRIALAV